MPFESSFRRPSGEGLLGEKASVTLLFVTLGLFAPVSPAWAKKDKLEVTLTAPAAGALYNAPAAVVLSAIAQTTQKNHPIAKVEFFQGANLIGAVQLRLSRSSARHLCLNGSCHGQPRRINDLGARKRHGERCGSKALLHSRRSSQHAETHCGRSAANGVEVGPTGTVWCQRPG